MNVQFFCQPSDLGQADLRLHPEPRVMRRWLRSVVCLVTPWLIMGTALAATEPMRLSDWLQAQASVPSRAELHWLAPSERWIQNQWRQTAMQGLPEGASALRVFLNALPLTGRVPVATTQPSRLRSHPSWDPRIVWGQQPRIFQTGNTVALLSETDTACRLEITQPVHLAAIWSACAPTLATAASSPMPAALWIVHPDASIHRVRWPAQTEDDNPWVPRGSWIWAPLSLHASLSQTLAEYLATLAPPDQTLITLADLPHGLRWHSAQLSPQGDDQTAAVDESAASETKAEQPFLQDNPYPRALWSRVAIDGPTWASSAWEQTGWVLRSEGTDGAVARLFFDIPADGTTWETGTKRLLPLLNEAYDTEVRVFDISTLASDLPVQRALFHRAEWLIQARQWVPPSLRLAVETPMPDRSIEFSSSEGTSASAQWQITPFYWRGQGTPSHPQKNTLGLNLRSEHQWGQGLRLSGRVQGIAATHARAQASWPAQAPTEQRLRLASLVVSDTAHWNARWTTQSYGGWVSPERFGLGAVLRYAFRDGPWDLTAQVNHLLDRNSVNTLGTDGAGRTTSLVGAIWQIPSQRLSFYGYAGQFLAGDRGGTLGVTKAFERGVTVAAEVTHSSMNAKPLFAARLHLPFETLNSSWRWGGEADLHRTSRFSDAGARLSGLGSPSDAFAPPSWRAR